MYSPTYWRVCSCCPFDMVWNTFNQICMGSAIWDSWDSRWGQWTSWSWRVPEENRGNYALTLCQWPFPSLLWKLNKTWNVRRMWKSFWPLVTPWILFPCKLSDASFICAGKENDYTIWSGDRGIQSCFCSGELQLQICALNLNYKNSGHPIAFFDGLRITVEKMCHWTINRNVK